MRGATLLGLFSALAFTFIGCGRGVQPREIEKIAVVQNICDPRCRSWGATLFPNGLAELSGNEPRDDITTHVFPGTFGVVADMLARKSAFFSGQSDYRQHPDQGDSTWITVWVRGAERQVVIPSSDSQSVIHDGAALERLASFVASRAYAARYKILAARRRSMANVSALDMVEYRANGCFGTCPAYDVRFFRNGHASMEMRNSGTLRDIRSRATVPFVTIVHVLQASDYLELEAHYPLRAVDVFGAHLHLRYDDGFAFDSDAPDLTRWSPEFQAIADRIDQVVIDAHWTPALPARSYPTPYARRFVLKVRPRKV